MRQMWHWIATALAEERGFFFLNCTLHGVTLYKVMATSGDKEETDIT